MLHDPFPNAFGLDIGDLSVKLVQLTNKSSRSRGPRYELKEVRSIHMPPGLIFNGELQKPEQVRHYLQKLLAKSGKRKAIDSPWVVASLPEPQGFIKLITIAKPVHEIIDDDVTVEAKKHIPFSEKPEYYVDWQTVPDHGATDQTNILIGAIPKRIADSYTYLLHSVGLGVVALEIEAVPIARSMVTHAKSYGNEARALLDIGATRASLIVYDNNSIRFSTTIRFSTELCITAIAQQLASDYSVAGTYLREHGLNVSKNEKVWSVLMKLTEFFIHEINKAIRFYYSHFPETNRITHITMCGGGSNIQRLPEVLTAELGIPCEPGRPWKNLSHKRPIPIEQSESLGYATAIGLAIRAADNPFSKSDII